MRKLSRKKRRESSVMKMHTQGSETSQYLEEKIPNSISLVAASEDEGAQTRETRFCTSHSCGGQDLEILGVVGR